MMDIIWLFRTKDTLRSFRDGCVSSAVSRETKLLFSLNTVLGLVTWTLYLIENKEESIANKKPKNNRLLKNSLGVLKKAHFK